jgi:hypothetical protein
MITTSSIGEDEYARWRKKQERLLRRLQVEETVTTVKTAVFGSGPVLGSRYHLLCKGSDLFIIHTTNALYRHQHIQANMDSSHPQCKRPNTSLSPQTLLTQTKKCEVRDFKF